jgi:SAM-dependent methyltransferase
VTALTAAGLVDHYRRRFLTHGDDPLSAQTSAEGQRYRFAQLLEIADLNDRSVLDLGCGLGHLYPPLVARYPRARYRGIDVVPEMVACAAAKYPNARFEVANLLQGELAEQFDYVLASGVFNNAIDDPTGFLESLIERAYARCRLGLGFNFISRYVTFTEPALAYHDPARVLSFCLDRLGPKVVMHHHYERRDVAVFVYR